MIMKNNFNSKQNIEIKKKYYEKKSEASNFQLY